MRYQGMNDDGTEISCVYVHKTIPHPGIVCEGPSLTRQEFAEECDINNIMAKYETTGVINHWNKVAPEYLDLSEGVPDLQAAMDVLQRAEAAFMTLPARTRLEFENDPKRFVAFAEDSANIQQMRDWGLAPPAPVVSVAITPAPGASPSTPAGEPGSPVVSKPA